MTDPIAAHLAAEMFDDRAARLVYAGPTGIVR